MPRYKVGDLVSCQVTGIENYGFFVTTDDKYSGLVHISEMSDLFVKNVNEYVTLKEKIFAKVVEVDEEKKNLKLSIKNINYKIDGSENVGEENGFKILEQMLPIWMSDALDKYKK